MLDLVTHQVVPASADSFIDPTRFPSRLALQAATPSDTVSLARWVVSQTLLWNQDQLKVGTLDTGLWQVAPWPHGVPRVPLETHTRLPCVDAASIVPGSTWLLWWTSRGLGGYHAVHVEAISTQYVVFAYLGKHEYRIVLEKQVFVRFCMPMVPEEEAAAARVQPGFIMWYTHKKQKTSVLVLHTENGDGGEGKRASVTRNGVERMKVMQSALRISRKKPHDQMCMYVNKALRRRMINLL